MLVIQKEEAKLSLTPDIALKNVGINPYLNRARTKAARKTEDASLASKLTNYVEYWVSQFKVKTSNNNDEGNNLKATIVNEVRIPIRGFTICPLLKI